VFSAENILRGRVWAPRSAALSPPPDLCGDNLFIFIHLLARKTTIMTVVTKVSVHEQLVKKANKLAFTIAHNKP